MREIKFRAWDRIEKKMINVFSMSWGADRVKGLVKNSVPYKHWTSQSGMGADVILQQFIGLLDKHGKEIYEGDVVRMHHGVLQVVYQAPSFVMKVKLHHKEWHEFILSAEQNQFAEVIGNIYENPELVKS